MKEAEDAVRILAITLNVSTAELSDEVQPRGTDDSIRSVLDLDTGNAVLLSDIHLQTNTTIHKKVDSLSKDADCMKQAVVNLVRVTTETILPRIPAQCQRSCLYKGTPHCTACSKVQTAVNRTCGGLHHTSDLQCLACRKLWATV